MIDDLWPVLLGLATPIAGVVGFAIHLRQVKKLRLENEKLELEIKNLRDQQVKSKQRIIIPTTKEVLQITRPDLPAFNKRRRTQDQAYRGRRREYGGSGSSNPLWEGLFIIVLVTLLIYFIYDLYRLFRWLVNAA